MIWSEDGGCHFLVQPDGTPAALVYSWEDGYAWRVDNERGGWKSKLDDAKKAAEAAAEVNL